jgi:hypothetical protein
MPVSSLTRFTVPLSTDQSASTQGLLMPKLAYRFRVTLDGFGVAGTPSTELTKQVMNVTRPDVSFEEIKLNVYNSTIKLAGKHSFAPATLVVRDDVTNSVSKKVGEQLQKQFDFYEQASAASGIDYMFKMRVEILDGGNGAYEPTCLESFEFVGCYLNKATYSSVDYSKGADALDINLSITYSNAIQYNTPGGQRSGLGIDVGRTARTFAIGG